MSDYFSKYAIELSRKPVIDTIVYPKYYNPPKEYQKIFCGSSLQDAYLFGAAFLNVLSEILEKTTNLTIDAYFAQSPNLIDFGCGWGRILRLLSLKYGESGLFGLDVNPVAIGLASSAMPNICFALLKSMPPSPLRDKLADVAISVSVFSHLGVPYQKAWCSEISRIVRPGGLAVITYHGPWIIDFIDDLVKGRVKSSSAWHDSLARQGANVPAMLKAWASGVFYFMPTGGAALNEEGAYGDVIAPRAWVEELWRGEGFNMLDWIEDRAKYPQCIAVLQRGEDT